jgi:cytochrome c oxidase subunit 2
MPVASMKAAGTSGKAVGLTSDEIWHLVDYVRSLPLENLSRTVGPDSRSASPRTQNWRAELVARVTVRQFDWQVVYRGADGQWDTRDDVYTVNELRLPAGEECEVMLVSGDVRHRIRLPAWSDHRTVAPGRWPQRLQLPGREAGEYPLLRNTSVGWGHPPVAARVIVEPREQWNAAIQRLSQEQSVGSYVRGRGGQGRE